jgi:hypothetical protein
MNTHPVTRALSVRRTRRVIVACAAGVGAGALLVPALAIGNARTASTAGVAQTAVTRPLLASLTGAQETQAADTDGTGAAAVTINTGTGEICVDLRVANITTPTAAHIHRGGLLVAGPVVVTLTAPSPTSAAMCTPSDPALALEISTTPSNFYINVHNADFPNGAIRGQLVNNTALVGSTQLLGEPVRAYDSRVANANGVVDGPLVAGATRTLSLATGINGTGQRVAAVPPGAVGALVRLTVTEAVGAGYLKLYSAALAAEPATSAANWYQTNSIVGSDATVVVDGSGQVKVTAGVNSTQVVIDVVGYIF